MKPTKKRLKDFVFDIERRVINEVKKEKKEARQKFVSDWFKQLDPEFKLLKEYYSALNHSNQAGNALLDILDETSAYTYRLHRKGRPLNFEQFKDEMFDDWDVCRLPGFSKVNSLYEKQIETIREQYCAVRTNIDRLTAKQGVDYLTDLGFDVEIFTTEESLLPMLQVDSSKLQIPTSASK